MLAAILAFGSACPVLAEFRDSGMLFIEGLEDAQPQLPEGPGDDGIVIDGLGDRRQRRCKIDLGKTEREGEVRRAGAASRGAPEGAVKVKDVLT